MVALETKSEPGEKPTFRTRLHAWWEGYYLDVADPEPEPEDAIEVKEPEVTPGLKPEDAEGWTRERIQAAQRVLGHGQLMAGGERFIHHLITVLDKILTGIDVFEAGLNQLTNLLRGFS